MSSLLENAVSYLPKKDVEDPEVVSVTALNRSHDASWFRAQMATCAVCERDVRRGQCERGPCQCAATSSHREWHALPASKHAAAEGQPRKTHPPKTYVRHLTTKKLLVLSKQGLY